MPVRTRYRYTPQGNLSLLCRKGDELVQGKIWYCKIGTLTELPKELPNGADWPMRQAIRDAFFLLTGAEPDFIFSGWAGQLDETELAVVENREPNS